MHSPSKALVLFFTMATPLASQARIDWQAKEASVYQAIVAVDADAFAANLDSAYVGVYPRGIVDRAAQVAGVKGEWTSFELSQFTARVIDAQTVLVAYRLTVEGVNGGSFWASTLWRLTGAHWRMLSHTAAPAT